MADPVTTGGGDPAAQTLSGSSSSPPAFTVPDGKMLLDKLEHDRNLSRLNGYQQYQTAGAKYGFKTPKDFERLSFLQTKGITLDQLAAAFANDDAATAGQPDGDAFDPVRFKKELGGEFVSKSEIEKLMAKQSAMADHKVARARESDMVSKALSELLGEKPSDFEKAAMAALLKEKMGGRLYPEGHPLYEDDFAPHDEQSIKPILDELRKIRAESAGAEVARIGQAAVAGKKTPTPAGSSAPSTSKNDDKPRTRADGRPHPDDVQAEFERRQAARKQGTVSSVGG